MRASETDNKDYYKNYRVISLLIKGLSLDCGFSVFFLPLNNDLIFDLYNP